MFATYVKISPNNKNTVINSTHGKVGTGGEQEIHKENNKGTGL